MLGAFLYPFQLAARYPLVLLLLIIVGAAALFCVDLAAAAIGFDLFYLEEEPRDAGDWILWAAHFAGLLLVGSLPAAVPMVQALRDKGRRRTGFRLRDLWLSALVTLWFVIIMTPFDALMELGLLDFLSEETIGDQSADLFVAWTIAYVIVVVTTIYLGVRFFFLWPLALRDGRIRLEEAWRATRGLFWTVVVLSIAFEIVGAGATMVGDLVLAALPDPPSVASWRDVFQSDALRQLAWLDVTLVVTSLYFAAAQGFAFGELVPADATESDSATFS